MSDRVIDPDRIYTIGRAAALLGCSRWALRSRIDDGTVLASRLPNAKGGNTWRRIAGAELLKLKGQILLASQPPVNTTKKAEKELKEALADLGLV